MSSYSIFLLVFIYQYIGICYSFIKNKNQNKYFRQKHYKNNREIFLIIF